MDNRDSRFYNNEDNNEFDSSGYNYAQADNYVLEEEEESDEIVEKKSNILLLVLKVLFAPVEGWKSIRREKLTEQDVQSKCFYPILAILAVASFAKLIYFPKTKISEIVVNGLEEFISFFFGYFCILILFKILLPSKTRHIFDTEFGKVFILISLSTLAIFNSIMEILPMLWALLIFLPIWTVYCMWRGIRFFKLPEKGFLRFTLIVCLCVIGVPYILLKLTEFIIPY